MPRESSNEVRPSLRQVPLDPLGQLTSSHRSNLAFRQYLKENIADLFENEQDSVFILIDDLNLLNTNNLQTKLGFDHIVNLPMHGANILDVFVTNRPYLFDLKMGQSLLTLRLLSAGGPDIIFL